MLCNCASEVDVSLPALSRCAQIKEEVTWGKVMNMIGEVNYTWDRSLGDSNAAIKASISGYVNLLMNEKGGWLTLRVSDHQP